MIWVARFFVVVLLGAWVCCHGSSALDDDAMKNHDIRIFPAPQVEVYTPPSDTLAVIYIDSIGIQPIAPVDVVESLLEPAGDRFLESLRRKIPSNPKKNHHLKNTPKRVQVIDRILVQTLYKEDGDDDESYELRLDDNESHTISITAETAQGAMHALQSLLQLLEFEWADDKGPAFTLDSIPLYVADAPRFSYRGLMIDTARHYLPKSLILQNLDAMAMNKLNVLHWHMTDSQSFPWKGDTYPELAVKGAYAPNLVYTNDDIREIQHYAYQRGIRVIPEVDMPGHTQSFAAAHPEWMAHCPDPSQPLDPSNPAVYKMIENIYQELSNVFDDGYIHVGGDEVNMDCWKNDTAIAKWMEQIGMNATVEAYDYFEQKLLNIVQDAERIPIVWQEVFNLNLSITDETIVDVWKGFDSKTLQHATEAGYQVILSGCWYLDHLNQNWKTMYDCNPLAFNSTEKQNLLGGHASMWGEMVDATNFMTRVWPRASAVAERLWTGSIAERHTSTIHDRLHSFRCFLIQQGIPAEPVGPGVCHNDAEEGTDVVRRPPSVVAGLSDDSMKNTER